MSAMAAVNPSGFAVSRSLMLASGTPASARILILTSLSASAAV